MRTPKGRMDALTLSRLRYLSTRYAVTETSVLQWYTDSRFSEFTINRFGNTITYRVYGSGMITEI